MLEMYIKNVVDANTYTYDVLGDSAERQEIRLERIETLIRENGCSISLSKK